MATFSTWDLKCGWLGLGSKEWIAGDGLGGCVSLAECEASFTGAS